MVCFNHQLEHKGNSDMLDIKVFLWILISVAA